VERLDAGLGLWRQQVSNLLVVSGGGRGVSEADAMANYLRGRGVPEEAILLEAGSANTRENALCCAPLLLPRRRRVVVVSQPFHLRRASLWFRRVGFEVIPWHHPNTLQFSDHELALRWIGREYLAWAKLLALELTARGKK
jgi:uncharacterized SAM-binding protein YcdF (DUF218 family)